MTTKNLINTILSFVFALSLTIIIEWGLSFIFLKNKKDREVVILAQVLTNPALNFLIFLNVNFIKLNQYLVLGFLEILAVIIEAIIYKNCFGGKVKMNPFLLSQILNSASLAIGLVIQRF